MNWGSRPKNFFFALGAYLFALCSFASPPSFVTFEMALKDDPYEARQTALRTAELPAADEIFYDSSTGIRQRVRLGVLDSGELLPHPEFEGIVKSNITLPKRPQEDFTDHGSKVTAVLGALAFNGSGIRGVAGTHADIIFRGVYNSGQGEAALNSLIDSGVAVINISLSTAVPCPNTTRDKKCQRPLHYWREYFPVFRRAILEKNIVIVTAAGNDGEELEAIHEDFAKGILVVGSMTASKSPASTSNYGPGVTLFAPIDGVLSFGDHRQEYMPQTGTSFASPLVAGAAALVVAYLRTQNVPYTAAMVRDLITQSATPYPKLQGKALIAGSLNYRQLAIATRALVESRKSPPSSSSGL